MIVDSGTLAPVGTSDHCVVYCHIDLDVRSRSSFKREIWDFRNADYAGLNAALSQAPFDVPYDLYNDIDDIVYYWFTLLKSTISDFIPHRSVKIRSTNKQWVTCEFRRLLRKRNRLWKRFKRTGYDAHYQAYKKVRNKVVSLNRKNIKCFVNNIDLHLSECSDPKVWWSNIKTLLGSKAYKGIPPISYEGRIINNDKEKADIFNKYFSQQCKLPPNAVSTHLPTFTYKTTARLNMLYISEPDVLTVLNNLPATKATGPDAVGNHILKSISLSIYLPLCKLFNYSLQCGKFPTCWKAANVCPIFKKNDNKNPANYRPISLLSNLSKVFERLVYKQLYSYFSENQLLNEKNSGFRQGDSTINQLVYITDKLYKAMDSKQEVRMVFLDAAKAFDKVWHKGLLFKLKQLGVDDHVASWFSDYLNNRKQRVVINGVASSWASLEAGVPQGSILGPLLFLVYVHDITDGINADINLFADDTSIFEVVADSVTAAKSLNSDLSRLQQWANQLLVHFNPDKTEVLTVSAKKCKGTHPPLYLSGTQLKEVQSHKHLGITLTNDLSWSNHISSVVTKASQRLAIMKRLKYTLHRSTLERLYKTIVRPILEYGCVLFDGCTQSDSQLIKSIQYQAARICSGALWNTNKESLLSEMGWDTLYSRRQYFKILVLYKMYHGLVPPYLSDIPLSLVSNVQSYSLRNAHHIRPPKTRTSRYARSFLPATIDVWNSLPRELTSIDNFPQFKVALATHLFITKSPIYWKFGERHASIYHTRLRLGHSSLNSDLCRHGLVDAPKCACGSHKEDVGHYFLTCPIYAAFRPELLMALQTAVAHIGSNAPDHFQNVTAKTDLLLKGSVYLTCLENNQLFLAVHQYITRSKRFV